LDLHGDTAGLGRHETRRLKALTRRRLPIDRLVTLELAREMTELSRELGRQVGVLVDRAGHVQVALIGTDSKVDIPDLGRQRTGTGRLLGLRLVHVHLKDEPLTRDDLTDLQVLRLDSIAAVQAQADGLPGKVHVAWLIAPNPQGAKYAVQQFRETSRVDVNPSDLVGTLEAEMTRAVSARHETGEGETTVLVVLDLPGDADVEDRTRELLELARTDGLRVRETVVQKRSAPDPRTLAGSGKVEQIALAAKQVGADLVVFDRELSGSQMRNITELTDLKVIDRTQLILDIFARHATTREGKLQVELAQLRYLLPRLTGKGTAMSRLAGGIGARGPGESKLETDRRRIRQRIQRLEQLLSSVSQDQERRRSLRRSGRVPVVSIVGYTNAGKSTLLNRLTSSHVLAEDKLFATLDPRSRRLRLPREREILVTDTVGFIRDLPPELRRAFGSTLAEMADASLLLHVVDASSPRAEEQMATVETLLKELGLDGIPVLPLFNKRDRAPRVSLELARRHDGIPISAETGAGLERVVGRVLHVLTEARAFRRRGGAATDDDESE
jgi:GTP-binding protein HflX